MTKVAAGVTNGRPPTSVEEAEFELWTTIDTMIRLLNELNPSPQQRIPMPSQFIGLIPTTPHKVMEGKDVGLGGRYNVYPLPRTR